MLDKTWTWKQRTATEADKRDGEMVRVAINSAKEIKIKQTEEEAKKSIQIV